MLKAMKRTAGYTIDQTILIVAVIAVLITLIIASVGWDLLNRTSGTKLASQLRQIEDANGQFFARQGVWPHVAIATGGDASCADAKLANMSALAGLCLDSSSSYAARATNLIAGLKLDGDDVLHGFGNTGKLSQKAGTSPSGLSASCPGASTYLILTLENIPETELLEADDAIDGADGGASGRLLWDEFSVSGSVVDAHYCANILGR